MLPGPDALLERSIRHHRRERLLLRIERIDFDPASWGRTLLEYPRAQVYQSPEWLTYLQEVKDVTPVIAEVWDGDRLVGHFVGGMVRTFGLRVLGSPLSGWGTNAMGFLLEPGVSLRDANEALLKFAYRDLGCVHVELRDRLATGADAEGLPYAIETRDTSDVDLSGSEEEILARMKSRTRTYIRRADRSGLVIEATSSTDSADEYYEQLLDVFASKGLVPTYGPERARRLIEIVGPSGQVAVHRLRDVDGQSVATIITVGRGQLAALWGLAWFRAAAKLHPVEPLQWAAMRYWWERGAISYDLDGVTLAKTKFGGEVRTEHHLNHSRHGFLDHGRDAARSLFYLRQRVLGRVRARKADAPVRGSA